MKLKTQKRRDIPCWYIQFSSFQSFSHVQLFETIWTVACQASLSFIISQSLHKLMSIESMMPSNHLTLCHPLLLLPSIFHSIRVIGRINIVEMCILPPQKSTNSTQCLWEFNSNGIFHRNDKKNLLYVWNQKKTPNSQRNFELEKWNGRHHTS